MGVYHFMGLGRSVGTVTGPLSYLGLRFQRWNESDQGFFGLSGEIAQRQHGEKVGDVQAIVLFTTREVFDGTLPAYRAIQNQPGRCPQNGYAEKELGPLPEAIRKTLSEVWKPTAKGRHKGKVYWCIVDRTNLEDCFQKAAQVILSAKSSGRLGKEIWINLTGGNNVINLALQLAAELTGQPARFYYVQAENPTAEKCLLYSREQGFWIDLPLLPVRVDKASRTLADIVSAEGDLRAETLFGKAQQTSWAEFQDASNLEQFQRLFLIPLSFQGFLEFNRDNQLVKTGRLWPLLRPYYQTIDQLGTNQQSLEQLAEEPWFQVEEIAL